MIAIILHLWLLPAVYILGLFVPERGWVPRPFFSAMIRALAWPILAPFNWLINKWTR